MATQFRLRIIRATRTGVLLLLSFAVTGAFVLVSTQRALGAPADRNARPALQIEGVDDLYASPLVPGESRSACVAVTYDGPVDDVTLRVSVPEVGALAGQIDVSIEEATTGDCAGSSEPAFEGTLVELSRLLGVGGWQADAGEQRHFLVSIHAHYDLTPGAATPGDLVWTVSA